MTEHHNESFKVSMFQRWCAGNRRQGAAITAAKPAEPAREELRRIEDLEIEEREN